MTNTLKAFIKEKWGDEDVARIARVRTGGNNNDKGAKYEDRFAVYLIARHAAEGGGSDVRVSAQELAWVDDLCVRIGSQQKINYQAKHSSTNAADWGSDMAERFAKQQVIDVDYHGIDKATQILLVSSEDTHLKNIKKIPGNMAGYAACEFYPFADPATHILFDHGPTFNAFADLCAEPNLDDMQTAMKAIMAEWANRPAATPVAVSDLVEAAKRDARPSVFKELDGPEPPEWLYNIVAPFTSASIKVQSGGFVVTFQGLSVRLPGSLAGGAPPDVAEKVNGEWELVELLFKLSSHANL